MSELEAKIPGKSTSTSSLTRSTGASSSLTPGKTTQSASLPAATGPTGNTWIDNGAACDTKSGDGCFLIASQRMRLMVELGERVMAAQTNYKLALVELRVDQLMKKEDDMNWVLGLALDVVGAHILRVGLDVLKNARAAGLDHLSTMVESKMAHAADGVLHAVSDEKIGEYATKAFGHVQKAAEKGGDKAANRDLESDKEKSVSYGDELIEQCDAAFQRFLSSARATSNDAELLVLHDEMDAANHTVGSYKEELGKKISRFTKSGVDEIGSRHTADRQAQRYEVTLNTRVVWVRDPIGGGKTLWYQSSQDAVINKVPKTFEPESAVGQNELERRVPDEFKEAAIAKSEARWGPTQTIANPMQSVVPSLGVPRLELGKKGSL